MLTRTKTNISYNESKLETCARHSQEEDDQVGIIRPVSQAAILAPLQTSGESTFGKNKVPSIHESCVDKETDRKSSVSSNSSNTKALTSVHLTADGSRVRWRRAPPLANGPQNGKACQRTNELETKLAYKKSSLLENHAHL